MGGVQSCGAAMSPMTLYSTCPNRFVDPVTKELQCSRISRGWLAPLVRNVVLLSCAFAMGGTCGRCWIGYPVDTSFVPPTLLQVTMLEELLAPVLVPLPPFPTPLPVPALAPAASRSRLRQAVSAQVPMQVPARPQDLVRTRMRQPQRPAVATPCRDPWGKRFQGRKLQLLTPVVPKREGVTIRLVLRFRMHQLGLFLLLGTAAQMPPLRRMALYQRAPAKDGLVGRTRPQSLVVRIKGN